MTCTICGRPSFAKLRAEIDLGAATYLICVNPACIAEACQRAADNLRNAAKPYTRAITPGDIITVDARELDPAHLPDL